MSNLISKAKQKRIIDVFKSLGTVDISRVLYQDDINVTIQDFIHTRDNDEHFRSELVEVEHMLAFETYEGIRVGGSASGKKLVADMLKGGLLSGLDHKDADLGSEPELDEDELARLGLTLDDIK